ncbi:hypothetical protein M433DRAFT_437757 [Acidomyces richmondensis BFW]|nr:hypothetical protein M433DRAFT_437757 [Acidomyces richmondensis BFW]
MFCIVCLLAVAPITSQLTALPTHCLSAWLQRMHSSVLLITVTWFPRPNAAPCWVLATNLTACSPVVLLMTFPTSQWLDSLHIQIYQGWMVGVIV